MLRTNQTWLTLLGDLLNHGQERSPRGQPTLELIGYQTVVPMAAPVVTIARRKLGKKFMTAEAAWILSGDNRVSSIAPYSKTISEYSDDGLTFNGAYGPKFVEQVGYVVRSLARDPETRQAVLTTWRERPGDTRDCPCSLSFNWLLRDKRLHCVATMRSSDAWLGIVYDWHAFSMMSAHVLLSLRCQGASSQCWDDTTLGNLYLTAGSQHLYLRNREAAEACLEDPSTGEDYPLYSLDQLYHPDELVSELWRRAGHGTTA